MKTFTISIVLTLFFSFITMAQEEHKVIVSEDAFVQSGETSNVAFGTTSDKQLKIMNSDASNKFARTTYLKFIIPKEIKKMESITLNLPVKISNRNKDNPNAKFKLDVYTVSRNNNNWTEKTLTQYNKPKSHKLIGSIEISPTGNEAVWQQITLNTYAIFKLTHSKRKRTITLVLKNTDFNRTSAILPSKDKSKQTASYLIIK